MGYDGTKIMLIPENDNVRNYNNFFGCTAGKRNI